MSQNQRAGLRFRVAGDGTPAIANLRDTIYRHMEVPFPLGWCYAESLKRLRQRFSRVAGFNRHQVPLVELPCQTGSPFLMIFTEQAP